MSGDSNEGGADSWKGEEKARHNTEGKGSVVNKLSFTS